MTETISRYIGHEVEIQYSAAFGTADKGILSAVSEGWLELTRNPGRRNEDVILVPFMAIRMVKPIAAPQTAVNTLGRPVLPDAQIDEVRRLTEE